MTVDVRPKGAAQELAELSKRLYRVEQQSSRPSGGGIAPGGGSNPSVNTITIGGIVVGSAASPATGLTLTTGAHMEDIWIDADWDAPADGTAASYDVELARKVGTSYELVNNYHITGGTSLRMSALEPQQTYGVRVTAVNRIGARSATLPASGFQDITTGIDATIPGPVSNLVITTGIRTLMATWNEVSDRDVAKGSGTYEVQLATENTFASPLQTKFTSGTITSFTGLTTGTTYWVRIRAVDNSGNAGPWTEGAWGIPGGATSSDLADNSVTTTKIANLAVERAKIADLAVDDAKIANLSADKVTVGTLNADRIAANSLSVEKLTTSTLTSKTITLGAGGVLKIGNAPTTGLLINDQGIRLYNGGVVKVALDVAGTATFEGNIQASTITTSTLTAPTINGATITGATVRTASTGQRIAFEAGVIDRFKMYTGATQETDPGLINVGTGANNAEVGVMAPKMGQDYAHLRVGAGIGASNPGYVRMDVKIPPGTSDRCYFVLTGPTTAFSSPMIEIGGIKRFMTFYNGGAYTFFQQDGGYTYLAIYTTAGQYELRLTANGDITTGLAVLDQTGAYRELKASAFTVSSSEDSKRNIQPETRPALDRIAKLKPVRFQRPHEPTDLPHQARNMEVGSLGFMAKDVLDVVPEAVQLEAKDVPGGLDLATLVCLALKGIQELDRRTKEP